MTRAGKMQRRWSPLCVDCGAAHKRHFFTHRCDACRPEFFRVQQGAIDKVSRAVLTGALPPASEFACRDCGGAATQYDHRDYTKPLDVEPVCRSCNYRRGPVLNWRQEAANA